MFALQEPSIGFTWEKFFGQCMRSNKAKNFETSSPVLRFDKPVS